MLPQAEGTHVPGDLHHLVSVDIYYVICIYVIIWLFSCFVADMRQMQYSAVAPSRRGPCLRDLHHLVSVDIYELSKEADDMVFAVDRAALCCRLL